MKNIFLTISIFISACASAQVAIGKASVSSPSVSLEFYDNADNESIKGASAFNKMYYNSTSGLIQGNSMTDYATGLTYILTQIRKSKIK